MEIRYINDKDDRIAISDIYEESWKHTYKGIIPQEYLENIPKGSWSNKIDTPGWNTMVLIEDGKYVGTSSFCKSRFDEYADEGEIISCKWQVLFHKFRQLFFHNYRHFIFHVFNLPRIAPWEWCLLKW